MPAKFVYCKTGVSRQYAPENPDWYYIRAAAVLRRLYSQGTQGMTDLRRMFGSAADGSCIPNHFKLSSGSIMMTIAHQLQAQGFVEIAAGEGRKITEKGKKVLDQFASQLK